MDCHQIDLSKILGPYDFTAEEADHIKSCPKCRGELEQIKSMSKMLQSYFDLADNAHCPYENQIPNLVWPAEKKAEKELESHMKQCPVCTREYMELKSFDHAFEAPPENSTRLPENLRSVVRTYRRQQSLSQTRKVLENFAAQTSRGKQWVEDVLEKAFSGKAAHPSPAARQDLTGSERKSPERNEKEQNGNSEPEEEE